MKFASLSATLATMLFAVVSLPACSEMSGVQEEILSERGGFTEPEVRLAGADEGDYCAAEVLRLRYDGAFDTLRVADARALMNCCGQRSLRVERAGGPIGGSVEITVRDEPDPALGRCEPGCAYDAAVGVIAAPMGPVMVRVLRDVTDVQGGPKLLWQGEYDPATTGPLSVVLDEQPAAASCGAAAL
ncbi:hypothetical protein [Chondromyces apiculatus]|uniref:Lipoprotein n=1 Tax=Chondromyces apiculatus DSM 436 TaxID=1192034 RepID=A0A017THP0_9BACT|nr:hypothetical protein [Chondromyces apiculatus]EYF08769.1 Hypothetical protein CAP_2630 [Chondromyces apiculatus DSM 436]